MKKRSKILSAGIFVCAVFVFVMWGPPGLFHASGEPEFCGSCHPMDPQYEDWLKTGRHSGIKCTDCHLPHSSLLNYTFWKGLTGMKDVVLFHSGLYSEGSELKISDHGKQTVQDNCVRCHENTVSWMYTESRNCWSCHRTVSHKYPSMAKTEY